MLNRYGWSLLCLVGSTQVQALDCVDAQRQLLAFSEQDAAQLSVADTAFSEQDAFVESKPSAKGKSIETMSFKTTKQNYEELWCKLKSQEAVLAESKLSALGKPKECADLNRLQLEEALASLPPEQADSTLEGLGIRLLADKDFGTGSQWAPSSLGIETSAGGVVSIQAMRLKSPKWIPVIGGMNYCKLLSDEGALALVQNQLAAQAAGTRIDASWQQAEWPGPRGGTQSALVPVLPEGSEGAKEIRGSFIISPGAEVPAEAMSGLANRLAEDGYLSFVVRYPNNSSLIENLTGRGNSAVNLAEKIKSAPEQIKGIDASSLKGKPVYVIGHSLGGATLAGEIFRNGAPSVFDHIFLYGVTSFIKLGGTQVPSSSPITFIFGENDGLSGSKVANFLKGYSIPYAAGDFELQTSQTYPQLKAQSLAQLNHFCIISDSSVGNGGLKKKDGPGLAPEACVDALALALQP